MVIDCCYLSREIYITYCPPVVWLCHIGFFRIWIKLLCILHHCYSTIDRLFYFSQHAGYLTWNPAGWLEGRVKGCRQLVPSPSSSTWLLFTMSFTIVYHPLHCSAAGLSILSRLISYFWICRMSHFFYRSFISIHNGIHNIMLSLNPSAVRFSTRCALHTVHSRVEWFSIFSDFRKATHFCWLGIFLSVQIQKIGNFGHANARAAQFSFKKKTRT